MPVRARWLFSAACCLLVLSGCGGPYEATVSGTVTLDGEPLADADIAFHPQGSGTIAHGRSADDGSYSLRTASHEGLAPGDYKVTVVVAVPATGQDTLGEPTPELLTPARYADRGRTELAARVAPGSNRVDLALRSKEP